MRIRPLLRIIATALAVVPAAAIDAGACPLCFGATPYETGLYWSVIFLLPIPFVIAGALGYWIYRRGRDTSNGRSN